MRGESRPFGRFAGGYRPVMLRGLFYGAAAGAAGTTALNTVTYVDMTMRGRAPSSIPERTVETIAQRLGRRVPGEGEVHEHRVSGLGALSGIATGVAVGAAVGLLRAVGVRPPALIGTVLVGAAAMAASDVPLAGLGISDPRTWSRTDWISDILPHLAYGAVTWLSLRALTRRR